MKTVAFSKVELKDGFWKDRYALNSEISIYAVQKVFQSSGRFDAVRFVEGNKNIHVYYDSDVAKWIEAVAYLIAGDKQKYRDLEEFCDELIAAMQAHQREDGYFNSYFQQVEPDQVFTRRGDHELYCLGHIIEAAIAYDQYVGKGAFLELAKKYVDLVYRVFFEEGSAAFITGGHEEIELALFKLYCYTGNEKCKKLAEFFVDQRGANEKDGLVVTRIAVQDNAPVRALAQAEGHAVRAAYLYCAMADYARINKDETLLAACKRVFDDAVNKKMYITGGIGSTRFGESFTIPYDLPSLTAYAESCAGIGWMLFCLRMSELENDAKYADVIERILYNVFLSSTSLDGKAFFYENPLEVCRREKDKETGVPQHRRPVLPIWKRKEVFDCSCCPPNINRFVASIGNVIYGQDKQGVYVHQYISSSFKDVGLTVETNYPQNGKVCISASGYPYKKLFVRIPAWCKRYTLSENGKPLRAECKNGYLEVSVGENFSLVLSLDIQVQILEGNPKIRDTAGKVCLTRGPVVYCLEEVDNGRDLFALYLDKTTDRFEIYEDSWCGIPRLVVNGIKKTAQEDAPLYAPEYKSVRVDLTFIPYFAFANREESDMCVWVNAL